MSIGSEFHTPQSWGKTRRPKALKRAGAIAEKEAASEVVLLNASQLSGSIDSTTGAGYNGYATENQRFLHLQIENNGTGDHVKLYAYNYAFGSWSELYLPYGAATQLDTGDGDGGAQTTNDVWVEAKWTSKNGKFMVTVPIHGIDRIAFVHDGTKGPNLKVRAACSSF